MPRKTRDEYFQECLNDFLQIKLGEDMLEHAGDLHPLARWKIRLVDQKGGREKGLVYSVVLPKEIAVGYIERNRSEEDDDPIKMHQYIPDSDTIKRIFQDAFCPFELWQADKCVSSTRIVGLYDQGHQIKLVILVRYYKDYMPFFADTLANRTIRDMNSRILIQDIQLKHLRDENLSLKYTEEALNIIIEGLTIEKATVTAKLGACKYERKMREMYCAAATLEECPVCATDIEKENLFIPPCAHFICSSCSAKCSSCPICRGPLAI